MVTNTGIDQDRVMFGPENEGMEAEFHLPDFVIKEVSLKELSYNIDIRDLKYVTRKNINNSFRRLISKVSGRSQWDDLESSLNTHDYEPSTFTTRWEDGNDYIQINQNNKILDGYARVSLLIRKYGNNFKIKVRVRKELFNKRINIKLFITLLILTTILILIFN